KVAIPTKLGFGALAAAALAGAAGYGAAHLAVSLGLRAWAIALVAIPAFGAVYLGVMVAAQVPEVRALPRLLRRAFTAVARFATAVHHSGDLDLLVGHDVDHDCGEPIEDEPALGPALVEGLPALDVLLDSFERLQHLVVELLAPTWTRAIDSA